MRILFTGGGTGGHLFPIIAVARQLNVILRAKPPSPLLRTGSGSRASISRDPSSPSAPQDDNLELFYLGPDDFGTELLAKEGIKIKIILAGKLRRYFSLWTILDIFKIPLGFCQALWFVYLWMPDVVFSKGGYGSVPVVLVSWLYRIPILIHESDTRPGLANRLGAFLAKRIALSFASTEKYFPQKKTALVGHPVRPEITQGSREEGRKIFAISSDKPVILIMGGSQGAQAINEIVLSVREQLLEKYEVIHISGPKNYQKIKAELKISNPSYHLQSFLDEDQLKQTYALADLVISRAGAGSIFEIAACAKPSILIPLPLAASNHQKENAFEYAQSGATVVIEQVNLTPHLFLAEISRLLDNPALLQKMSDCARSFAKLEASQKIAEELIELGK